MADLATVETIENAWRPLSPAERGRAEYYIGKASRDIRRRWPDVDARIADSADPLTAAEVSDVVVALVMSIVPKPSPGARSWQQTAGQYSEAVTLPAAGSSHPMTFESWMIAVFERKAVTAGGPLGSFPETPPFDRIFGWRE